MLAPTSRKRTLEVGFQNLQITYCFDIFEDSNRVFNLDETNIQLCPSTGKVVSIRGTKNVYEVAPGPCKSNLTSVGAFNASGAIVAPAIIYPYIRLLRDIAEQLPDDFYIGHSESGWMTSATFFEYIANAFIPWIESNQIQKPVFLFIDGHSSHLSMQVSTLHNQTFLYLLPPNTTHILQPADVGPFRALKQYWREEVRKYQRNNVNETVRRVDVAPVMKQVLARISVSAISNEFRATGLYPLNADSPDYSKCLQLGENNLNCIQNWQHQTQHLPAPMINNTEKYRCALDVIDTELEMDTNE